MTENLAWISKGTNRSSGTLSFQKNPQFTDPSDLVVTILSSDDRTSCGVLYPSKDGNMYLIQTYHSVVGDIETQVLVYNVNGKQGNHVILPFVMIGVERTSDIAVSVCTTPSVFDMQYYRTQVSWATTEDIEDGEGVVVVGDSDIHGSHLKSFGVVKKTVFFGSGDTMMVKSRLIDNVSCNSGGSGSGVFVNRRGISTFIGIVSSRLSEDDYTNVTVAVHSKLVLTITVKIIQNWKTLTGGIPQYLNLFQTSQLLKRSYKKAFLGVLHTNVTIATLNTFPSLRDLSRKDSRYSFGGILITAFIHGFDKGTESFMTDAIDTIGPNQVRVQSILQDSIMYASFITNGLPILLIGITYKKWDPAKNMYVSVNEKLGQFPDQVGLSEFNLYADPDSPITLSYYINQDQVWNYQEETLTPTPVTYTDEDFNEVTQSNLAYPYPLYGLEQIGKVQFLVASSTFTPITSPQESSLLNGKSFYLAGFENPKWRSFILAQKGRIVTTLSSNTSFVIGKTSDVKRNQRSDLKKATQLKIPTITQETAKSLFQLP